MNQNGALTFKFPYLKAFGETKQQTVAGSLVIAAKNKSVYMSKDFGADDVESVTLTINGKDVAYDANKFKFAAENDLTKSGTVAGSYYGVAFTLDVDPTIVVDDGKATLFGESKNTVNIEKSIKVDGPISLKRKMVSGPNMYSTMMLPFSVKASALSDKATFYKFLNVQYDHEWELQVSQVNDDVTAHTPYLVQVADADADVFTFDAVEDGYTLESTGIQDVFSECSNGWQLNGSYSYYKWEEGDAKLGSVYGFANDDGQNDPSIVGKFAKIGAGAYIYPMRVYLEYVGTCPVAGVRAAPGSARATVTASIDELPENLKVVVVNGESADEERTVLGTLNTRTGAFKAADRYFNVKGSRVGKKPAAKGSYYKK